MNNITLWIIVGLCGLIGLIFFIGIIAIVIKFFIKHCRKRPWSDITSPPVTTESVENIRWSWSWTRSFRRSGTDREPIINPQNDVIIDIPHDHVAITINENDESIDPPFNDERSKQTLVQIQRDRLERMKEERRNNSTMILVTETEDQVQRTIDQVQREFDESF